MTLCLYFLLPRPLISTLFPYTTLFRSAPFRTCRFLGIAVAAGGAMANGFESDFIAQGKKMKSLRARMHHNGKDAGAGTLEYLGIILFVGLIVVGLVLTASPIGSKLAEKLCEAFGTSCPAVAAVDEKAPPARACEQIGRAHV